jgi:hypothetical protein
MPRLQPQIPVVALALAMLAGACAERASTGDGAVEAVEPREPAAAEPPEIRHDIDEHPPAFDGLESVELVGLETFHLRWSAASDDRTPSERIRYRVYHLVEPFAELSADTSPIYTTAPGATQARFANAAPAGRYYVRAVDEAENMSAIGEGILQRSARPLLRTEPGVMPAALTACVPIGEGASRGGRALCVGDNGTVARWDGASWTFVDVGVTEPLRLAQTIGGAFIYSAIGHLFAVGAEGQPTHVDVRFPETSPTLPFRQFTVDRTGLRYWIDAEGRVFVGSDREFVHMRRPLALPGDECQRVRGLAFADVAGFALCEGGVAWSMGSRDASLGWLSLTPNADFEAPSGIASVISDVATEAILVDATGVRRIGVGGWRPLLLVDWRVPGIHPMDVPDEPPVIGRVVGVHFEGDTLHASTDEGVFALRDLEWRPIPDLARPVAGVVPVGAARDRQRWIYIFADGAVAEGSAAGVRWLASPEVRVFPETVLARDGRVFGVEIEGAGSGLYEWEGARWVRRYPLPDAAGGIAGLAAAGREVHAFGRAADGGVIASYDGRAWRPARWLHPPEEEPAPPEGDGPPASGDADPLAAQGGFEFSDEQAMVFAPPPALRGVTASALSTPPPGAEPIRMIDGAADGRAVAVGEHQVWWRLEDGWRLLTTRSGTVTGVWLDAGETYVLLEDGVLVRCWRDQCGAPVPAAGATPPGEVQVFRGDGDIEVATSDGSAWRFVAASHDTWSELIDPSLETPAGTWEATVPVGAAWREVAHRLGDVGVMLLANGEVFERADDEWVLQAEGMDATGLLATPQGWSMVSEFGLLRLGDVPPARRIEEAD